MFRNSRLKRIVLLLLVCSGSWLPPVQAAEMPFGEGLLFQIQQADQPLGYLFGTIHSEDPRVVRLPDPVEKAFRASSRLLLEIDMAPANLLASMAGMFLPEGERLPEILGPQLYRRSVEAARQRGMPEVALKQYKPWAVAMLFSLPPVETGQFLDLVLYQRALERGMPVAGLEAVSEQLALFEELSAKDQVHLLRDALNNLDRLPIIFQMLLEKYLQRDLKGLMTINDQLTADSDQPFYRRFQARLLDQRNQRMVDRLEPSLAEGGLFVAVGALHLPGEQGMLKLLEQRGYRIVRIF